MYIIAYLFWILSIFAFTFLVIGLIHPFIFKSRSKIVIIFGTAIILFWILGKITNPSYIGIGHNISKDSIIKEPYQVIEKYYNNIIDGKYDENYDLITEKDRKLYSKTDYVLYQIMLNKYNPFIKATILQKKLYTNKKVFNIKYNKIISYLVKKTGKNYNSDFKVKVVLENNNWKLNMEELEQLDIEYYTYEALNSYKYDNTLFDKDLDISIQYLDLYLEENDNSSSSIIELDKILKEVQKQRN